MPDRRRLRATALLASSLLILVGCGDDEAPPGNALAGADPGVAATEPADGFSPPPDSSNDGGDPGVLEDTSPPPDSEAPEDADATQDVPDNAPDEGAPDTGPDIPLDPPPQAAITTGYWTGIAREAAQTPYGGHVVIVCHNCYVQDADSPEENLIGTLEALHTAQNEEADGLELDITLEDGLLRVDHNDDGEAIGAPLTDVLADPDLQDGDQLLFVEVKTKTPVPPELAGMILDTLISHGFGQPHRPVVLRAFRSRRQVLIDARDLVASGDYPELATGGLRLHELWGKSETDDEAEAHAWLALAATDGLDGVELDHRSKNVFGRVGRARQLGLGVGLWTMPSTFGEAFIAAWRHEVDALVTDYPVGQARAVVGEDNALLYMSTRDQSGYGDGVLYRRRSAAPRLTAVNGGPYPTVSDFPPDEDLVGGVIQFDDAAKQALRLGPVTVRPGAGVLITAVVNFDDLGATDERMILGNADSAGFYLRVKGDWLDFAVRVGGKYVTSSYPRSKLNGNDAYLLIGAYDGDGGVRLWVAGSDVGVDTATATGPLVQSASPVLVGADPQGPEDTRYYFDGKIQQVQVLSWSNHFCKTDDDCASLDTECEAGTCSALGLCTTLPATTKPCLEFEELLLVVRTADSVSAGTDDPTELCLSESWCAPLDNGAVNDNEVGQTDHHRVRGGPGAIPLDGITLQNPAGKGADAWRPACVAIVADGQLVYCNNDIQPLLIGSDPGDTPSWTDPDVLTKGCAGCYPTALTHGPMVGLTTDTTSRIWVRTASSLPVLVRWGTKPNLADAVETEPVTPQMHEDFSVEVPLTSLPPGGTVYYEVWVGGALASASPLSFRTAPGPGAPTTIAYGSCMKFAYSGTMPVFDALLATDPDLLLMLGDNHYANSADPDRLAFFYRRNREVTSFAQVIANMSVAATWDDHDYTGNNTSGVAPGKTFALDAFGRYWSQDALGTADHAGVWNTFSWGDIDVFLIDDRWYRSQAGDTMMGKAQVDWLLGALAASTATFKLVGSGSQWTLGGSTDSWAVFEEEREEIFDFIMANDIGGVVLLSGDVHRAEVRRLRDKTAASYELWELTSSPFAHNNSGCKTSPQPDTVAFCAAKDRYFNLLHIDTGAAVPQIIHEVLDEEGTILHTQKLTLDQLTL